MGTPFLILDDVSRKWGDRTVLSHLSLTISYGDTWLITGPNGSGKTTLLRIMLGLLEPTAGSVKRFSRDNEPISRFVSGYLPQKSAIDSKFPISVAETVETALLPLHLPRREREQRVMHELERVGMEQMGSRVLGELSGGQVQRVLLARALVARCDFVVLDEPLSYIDSDFQQRVVDIINEESRRATLVIVSHDRGRFEPIANKSLSI